MSSIGGGVSGLNAGQSLVLWDNGGDSLTVSANGPFTFATRLNNGDFYNVTVSPPLGTSCTVTGGSGTAWANVTGVEVACSTPPPFVGYSVGGSVAGLVGQGLVLNLYGLNYTRPQVLDQLVIGGNTIFQFTTTIGSSGPNQPDIYPDLFHYAVGIHHQPQSPAQQCAISDRYSDFTITANIADVSIVCGEFSYSTSEAGNSISAFSVDASTGALIRVGSPVATGRSPHAMASTGDRGHLYVANGDSNDVSAFDIDPGTGALTQIPGAPFAAGTRPRAIALYRSTLFVANAGSNNLSVFRVDPTSGVPTPWASANYATGTAPSVIGIDPGAPPYGSSPVVYVANTGSNDISAFLVLGALGPQQALEAAAGSPFPSGKSVASLAFGNFNRGRILFAANATGSDATISAFSIDSNTTAWPPLPGFPFALPSCNFVAADRTGRYLYAAAGTQLFGYRIDEQTGALSALPGSPIAVGTSADSISVDVTNQFLYVRNGSAETVTGFDLDAATGALTPMPVSPFAVGQASDFFATF
jgi:6-phosphogluconolactonase